MDGELRRGIDRMREAHARPRRPLDAIGLLMVGSTQDTIDRGGRPERFAPWSDSYADRRPAGNILVLNSILLNSIVHDVSGWTVHWGTNVVYAARMQFGWPPGSADETPARPFINTPFDEDWREIADILREWAFGKN